MQSVLTSVKKLIGIDESYEHFDPDITMFINAALLGLTQIGVGPATGMKVESKLTTWEDLFGEQSGPAMEAVKAYLGMKVRLMFDPPTSSALTEAIKNTIEELEWRITLEVN